MAEISTKVEADLFATACKLLMLGYSVVPSGGGDKGKSPLVSWREYQMRCPTEQELNQWQEQLRPQLWGIVTGQVSGVVTFDADTREAREVLESAGLQAHIISPRKGGHFHVKHPGYPVKTMVGLLPGLDVRGDGGFVNIIGKRPDGEYQIVRLPTPDNLYPWDCLPVQIRDALNSARPATRGTTGESVPIPEGQRNACLTSLAGSMRLRGMTRAALLAALREENEARCIPPLPDEEVQRIAESVAGYEPARSSIDSGTQSMSVMPWPSPLAEEAFHGLAGEVVRAIEPCTEADPVAMLINFLTFFGNAVGQGPHAVAEADKHRCNLNTVLVGETSKGRKGSSQGHIRELFLRVDPDWIEQRMASGMSSGEGVIWEVRNAIERLVKGKIEVVDEGVKDKRLLICEAEFSAPLKVMAREGNTLSATLRQAWDSGMLRILTKNSPAKAAGAHISILGHITRGELLRYLNDTELANGFANRFLWVCVKRSKVLPEGGGSPDYREIVPALKSALDRARMIGELKRDTEARRIWADIYPELSEGKPGLFGSVTARAEAQVLRLSVLFAALDGDNEIRPVHLAAALALWDYCEASARYIFGDALGDPVADRLLQMLRQRPEGLNRTGIHQLFSRHVKAARIEEALRLLQTSGRAWCEIRDTEGRPAEYWRTT